MTVLSKKEWSMVLRQSGQMPEMDLKWLIEMASGVSSWTEVGVFAGRSALAVGLALPVGSLLQLVDIYFQPKFKEVIGYLIEARPKLTVTILRDKSADAANVLPDTDVVFIDDDHSYEGVKASVSAWENKCRILCGHDHPRDRHWPPHDGVRQAVDELCNNIGPVEGSGLWLRVP